MSVQPSEEAIRQLHLRYRLAAETAKTYYDSGFSVVLQDNYYGEELPRMVYDLAMDTLKARMVTWEDWEAVSRASEKAIPAPERYGV